MTDHGPRIIIAGTREDWPGGVRTLTPREPTREPNGSLWFGAEFSPDGKQVWFRIASETVDQLPADTPGARGDRLIDALLAWLPPDDRLERDVNRFEVQVSDEGDTWIERLRW